MQLFNSKKISLRWQWAVYLSAAFMCLYLLMSYFMVVYIKEQHLEEERQFVKAYTQEVAASLSHDSHKDLQSAVQSLFLSDEESVKDVHAYALQSAGIAVRVIDDQKRIVYESREMPYLQITSDAFQELTVNQKKQIVTSILVDNKAFTGQVQLVFQLPRYYARVQLIHQAYVFVSVLFVLLCIGLGNVLAYIFFKPIKHMTDVMLDIKKDVQKRSRMDLSSRRQDELTDLSIGFNELLDTMDLYINQQKQFVEDVSHELRTPVAIVEGHLKLLNRWGKDDPTVLEESLSASLSELDRMKTLVQEMLDLSRAEQVGVQYKNEMTEIVNLVEQVHQNFQLIHPNFVITLEEDYSGSPEIWVSISRHHLEQVLIILLDNAVKYSTNLHNIHLSISKTVSNVQISVQDFGEGISQADLAKVFGRFYRVDKARSRHKGGNGLGLSIAKELIEGYQGNISVESVLNSGTTFRIELPFITDIAKVKQAKRLKKQEMEV